MRPIWTIPDREVPGGNLEGAQYRKYIAIHPSYHDPSDPFVYMRSGVKDAVLAFADNLPPGLTIVVVASHRPEEVQLGTLEEVANGFANKKKLWFWRKYTEEQALDLARTYVSDPVVTLPPHCCGAAVDMYFEYDNGERFDLGAVVNQNNKASHWTARLPRQQQENRWIIFKAFVDGGLAPYLYEIWHVEKNTPRAAKFFNERGAKYRIVAAPEP